MNSSIDQDPNRTLTLILYVLYIAAIFTGGLLAIIALIINYVKRSDVQGSIFASHFTWQIRTFWWYLAWNIIAFCRLFSCSLRVKIPIYLRVLLSHRLCSVWVLSQQHGSGLYIVPFAV